MPKSEFISAYENQNWNVAVPYTQYKIMEPLKEIDLYIKIALFGTLDIDMEMQLPDHVMALYRVKALRRLARAINMLINNTEFALKKQDLDEVKKYKENVVKIHKSIKFVTHKVRNERHKTSRLVIDEERFDVIFDALDEIASRLLAPLNRADMIFTSNEDFDPDKMKRELMEDIINSG